MSRTKKEKIEYSSEYRTVKSKRMKPYLSDKDTGFMKFTPIRTPYVDGYTKGVSATEKLETKNANRSKKKGMRQQSNKIIEESLNDI